MNSNQPQETLLRLTQIIGDPATGITPIIPVKKTAWWAGIKTGRYPQPVKIGARAVAWKRSDIDRLIASL
jgi:predicted DNA-binding transcriptional regulator AlpA